MPEFLSVYPPVVWLVLLATGLLIGVLAGLLGVGGGIISVPILLDVFAAIGIPEPRALSLAIGTSHASILLAAVVAVSAHRRGGTIDPGLVRAWLPALTVGALTGLVLGPFAPAEVLTTLFAVIAIALSVKLAIDRNIVLSHREPRGFASHVAPGLVGTLAASVAVGGGTLSTPVLSLFSFPIRRAIGAGSVFNIVIALPATAAFLVFGLGASDRPPDAVGYVSLFCLATLTLPALFVAPMAARWSTRAPLVLLRRMFALCLAVIGVKLLLHL